MTNILSLRPQNKPAGNPNYFESIKKNLILRREAKIKAYEADPKFCKQCSKIIPFWDRRKFFCDSGHSAQYNNAIRDPQSRINQGKNLSAAFKSGKIKPTPKKDSKYVGEYSKVWFRKCCYCKIAFRKLKAGQKYCTDLCESNASFENSIKVYRRLCKFNVNRYDHPELFSSDLIKKYGWYAAANRGNNLTGVTWDHLFRIEEGFRNKIDPQLLAHPANAELVPWPVNHARRTSQITLDELKDRIIKWDNGDRNLQRFYL